MTKQGIKAFIKHPLYTIKKKWKKNKRRIFNIWYSHYYGNNIILLESHVAFDGNSGALYNFMKHQEKYKKYTYVWLLNSYLDGSIRNKRHVLVFSIDNNSKKKQWLLRNALIAFYDDVPIRADNSEAKTVYLTHGCPPIKNVKGIINVPDYVDYAIASSTAAAEIASEQYSFPKEKFIIAGQPRNDVLFEEKKDIKLLFNPKRYSKVILWMPTFRKAKSSDRNDTNKFLPYGIPLFKEETEFESLNMTLKRNNLLFVIKLHPLQDTSVVNLKKYSNIITLTSDDLQKARISTNEILPYADALITDYSTVYFDYLLLDKPIAFLFDDIDDYKLGLINEYDKLIFGNRMMSVYDLISFVNDIALGIDKYSSDRKRVKDEMHQFQHGGYCKRILELFKV